jgi:hypothetical protein
MAEKGPGAERDIHRGWDWNRDFSQSGCGGTEKKGIQTGAFPLAGGVGALRR